VIPSPVSGPARGASSAIRKTGILILAGILFLLWLQPPWLSRLQTTWFDAYQRVAPRAVESLPVVIVAIDDPSIAVFGQWPWPRTTLARLLATVAEAEPAAIGVDILMPEPDRLSAERLLDQIRQLDVEVTARLSTLRNNDEELARTIAQTPTVLPLVGTNHSSGILRAPPILVRDADPNPGAAQRKDVPKFSGVVASLDELDRAASGRGLISLLPTDGIVRRIPLLFDINGTLAPAMSIELLRVAQRAGAIQLQTRRGGVDEIAVGAWRTKAESDGAVRPYFSHGDGRRFVSALDVLDGKIDDERFRRKVVLIDVTGLGLVDFHNTPLREPIAGSEVQAQLIENLLDGTLLTRPSWARIPEMAIVLLLGALLIFAAPRWSPWRAGLLAAGSIVLPAIVGYVLFRTQHWLIDAATPGLALLALSGGLLVMTFREATRQEALLEEAVQASREQAARMAGELEAAQRIQVGMLPRADLLRGDDRIELAAAMTPAREVGGDLYDFFRLDERRLFFLIGDVAGKGLSASIFMAVSKALYKSVTLRAPEADLGALMAAANLEVSRDNADMLFVAVFAAILDLDTGELDYCNAGHENPYLLSPNGGSLAVIGDGDGPPLCAVDHFDYRGANRRLQRGELLCCVTDGVTDAQNPTGLLYGSARLEARLSRIDAMHATPQNVVDAVRADVTEFAAGAEPADDLTVLALRWNGARPQ
jgi:serine phosphatase RsbU (regulator of sigma subunit)/CHASE2 domain-containing sensor protein